VDIAAYPESVNVLETIENDIRTPDKLIDGINEELSGAHTWLAPILPDTITKIYVIFDQPVTVSSVKLWNYAKTPARGVREFAIMVDDLLVYTGQLNRIRVQSAADGAIRVPPYTVLFTQDEELNLKEGTTLKHLKSESAPSLDHQPQVAVDQALRPYTSLTTNCRR
ncbi:unnamed protein product, partial [Cyprideis torosa]